MIDAAPATSNRPSAPMIGASAVLVSLVAQNVGAAFAKHLFPLVGAYGTTGLRIALAALLLFALRRPWRRRPSRAMQRLPISVEWDCGRFVVKDGRPTWEERFASFRVDNGRVVEATFGKLPGVKIR